jgi:hypothetical protein
MLIMTCFQWRMNKRLAGISAALPAALGVGPDSAVTALPPDQEPNLRLPGTIVRTEKRAPGPDPSSHIALNSRAGSHMSIENRSSPGAAESVWKQHVPA